MYSLEFLIEFLCVLNNYSLIYFITLYFNSFIVLYVLFFHMNIKLESISFRGSKQATHFEDFFYIYLYLLEKYEKGE
jgi:hypothetical protein